MDYIYADAARSSIRRLADGACIPADPANRDFADLIASKAEIASYVAPPVPVPTISKAQALLFLWGIGKSETDVDAAIAAIADPQQRAVAQIEWRYRQPFRHDHPLFAALAPALGIDAADLPDTFRRAALM